MSTMGKQTKRIRRPSDHCSLIASPLPTLDSICGPTIRETHLPNTIEESSGIIYPATWLIARTTFAAEAIW